MLAPDAYVCHCDCHRAPECLPHRKPCCEEYARLLLAGDLDLSTGRESSVSAERPPKTVLVADRTLLIAAVQDWADARRTAREEYEKAVRAAIDAGIAKREVAIAAGVTPTAIRLLLQRSFK